MKQNRVIITGATGMIGATLAKLLLSENVEVVAVVRSGSLRLNNLPIMEKSLTVIECDLQDILSLSSLVTGGFDIFYHFGWEGTTKEMRSDVHKQLENVTITLNAVKVAHELGCKVFVGAGSQAEYGQIGNEVVTGLCVNPNTAYGVAKYSAGKLSSICANQLGIGHIWCRIFSVYGPYDNEDTLVMTAIRSMLNKQSPKSTKGEQLWDYLYSEDAARAFKLIGAKGIVGKTYCIGSGNARPLIEYMQIIRDAIDCNMKLGIGEVPYTDNQIMRLCADIEELKADVGFEPKTYFEEGIKKTIEWVRGC